VTGVVKGLSRTQVEQAATINTQNVTAYGQNEEVLIDFFVFTGETFWMNPKYLDPESRTNHSNLIT